MSLFPNNAINVVLKSWSDYLDETTNARRAEVRKLIDFYNGDQNEYTKQYIKIKSIDQFPFYYTNLTKKIIKRVAQVYKDPPSRFFNEDKNEKYEEITKRKNITMKIVNRQSKLLSVVGVQPIVDGKIFDYFILRDFQAQFDEYNSRKPNAIRYIISGDEKTRTAKYMVWTNELNYIEDSEMNRYLINGRNGDENPYGVIPFVWCHSEHIIDDFWNAGGNAADLVTANEQINLKLSQMSHKFRFKSFDPIWISGDAANEEIAFGYDSALIVPEGSTVGSISQTHSFMDDIEVIKFEIQLIERNYNLSINWGIEGNAASGFSLVVQNIDHSDDLDDQIGVARDWEENILDMERIVGNIDGLKVPKEEMRVNFAEVQMPISQTEKNMKWQFEFDNKLATRADYFRSENPDISDEEIEQKIKDIADEEVLGKELTRTEPTITEILGE